MKAARASERHERRETGVTNSRGLELGDMESVSDHEVKDFANFYNSVLGHRHIGLDLWLDTRPDVLKRYRQYSDTATPRTFEDDHRITGAGTGPSSCAPGWTSPRVRHRPRKSS